MKKTKVAKATKAKFKSTKSIEDFLDLPVLVPNQKQRQKRVSKAGEAMKKMREHLWPDVHVSALWDRKVKSGFTTLPRTMPMLMEIINDLSKNEKGKSSPAGKAYLVLWCRAWDQPIVKIDNQAAAAAEAGYTGERNVSVWRSQLKTLTDMGFIDVKDSAGSQFILIFNPYHVVYKRKDEIQPAKFTALYHRAIEIGADEDFK